MSDDRLDREAVTATDAEVRGFLLEDRPNVIEIAADATSANDNEMRTFERTNRRVSRPTPVTPWIGAGMVLVVAASAFLLLQRSPEILPGTVVTLTPDTMVLGDVGVDGTGHLRVRSMEPEVQLVLLDGSAHFQVGDAPASIWFGDAWIYSANATFSLGVDGLVLESGQAQVVDEGTTTALRPGDRWIDAPTLLAGPEASVAANPSPDPSAPPKAVRAVIPRRDDGTPEPADAVAWSRILDRIDHRDAEIQVLADIRSFQRKWPGSAFAREAEATDLELTARITGNRETLPRIDDWLELNPESPHRDGILVVAAEIAKDRLQDCALALPYYRELATRRRLDRTVFAWYGLCAIEAGTADEADDALEASDKLGIDGPLGERVRAAIASRAK